MISAFDLLKAMNEEACCESMIEERACEHVYCERSTKALSLSDVFLDVIVKKMRVVWKKIEWMTMLNNLKKKDVCLFNKEDVSESDWSWSNSRRFFIIILLIDLIL